MLVLLLWAMLCVGCAVFLKAFETLPGNAHISHKLGKGLGLLLFLVGAAQLAGALAGETDPRYPLKWLAGNKAQASVSQRPPLPPSAARRSWTANWPKPAPAASRCCWIFMPTGVSCKEMESETFPMPPSVR
jgi:thiol:disulfide interchange protein DsbD